MEEKLAKLQAKLEADESFLEKMFNLENAEEVQGLFKEQGLDFSLEEIHALKDALLKVEEMNESGELSDEALGDVAGGSATVAVLSAAAAIHTLTGGRSTSTIADGARRVWRSISRGW